MEVICPKIVAINELKSTVKQICGIDFENDDQSGIFLADNQVGPFSGKMAF